MTTELLIYALIAGVLVFWLRNTLGTTHGEERKRPNPLENILKDQAAREKHTDDAERERVFDIGPSPTSPAVRINEDPLQKLKISNDDVRQSLRDIMRADSSFDPQKFEKGAREAFAIIVEAFAKGDSDLLSDLLAPKVFAEFARVIEDRHARGETVTTDVHAVRDIEFIEARLAGRQVWITLRITAEETCVIRDADGKITSGNPDKIYTMVDVWVFGREIGSRDPTWLLTETRDDTVETFKTPLPEAGA